jgi:drug/metabolite transporter (DMT)-like permease
MSNSIGVAAALVSSALGGTAGAITRYLIGASDPQTLATLRFGIAFLLLLPVAVWTRSRWPQRADWFGAAALGVVYFALFFFLYNLAMSFTTAARGSLALATLPLTTMLIAAALGRETLTGRKTLGVFVAVLGVGVALAAGLSSAPAGAWRGDLIMLGATVIMAFYTVWSRAFVQRSSRLGFLVTGMGAGSTVSLVLAGSLGGLATAATWTSAQWTAGLALGVFGGAAAFYLWSLALDHTTPTRVANTMTINPVAAAVGAAVLVGEPIGLNLVIGVVAVALGIALASTESRTR